VPRLIDPNPANPAFHGESRVVNSPTRDLTPPGTKRAHNGSAIPTDIDTALQARVDELTALGWRFDPVGTPDFQVSGYDSVTNSAVVLHGSTFEACVGLAEQKQADINHKLAIGWN
jgi:hypothetical protein